MAAKSIEIMKNRPKNTMYIHFSEDRIIKDPQSNAQLCAMIQDVNDMKIQQYIKKVCLIIV